MKYIKDNFKTNIKIIHLILYTIFGIALATVICAIFIKTGIIKYGIKTVSITKEKYYTLMFINTITSCLISPFLEELVYRGLLYNYLSKKMNIILSSILTIILSSIFFISPQIVLFSIIAGVIYMLFYIKTKNLLVTFMIHMGCNIASLFRTTINTDIVYLILYIALTVLLGYICYNFKYVKSTK